MPKAVAARNFFPTSPMFDSVEIIPDSLTDCRGCGKAHPHRCHLCSEVFLCVRPACEFEDRYAVCFNPVCIAEFESDSHVHAFTERCFACNDKPGTLCAAPGCLACNICGPFESHAR